MIVCAIDPASRENCAVARYSSLDGALTIRRKFQNLREIAQGVAELTADADRVVIEQVHAMPGQGVCSMFTFGRGTGAAMGAFFARSGRPLYEVTPQRWQNWTRTRVFDSLKPFDSTELVHLVFTDLSGLKKPRGSLDHNACDAALIAYWAANQTEEEMQARISEHWKLPEKAARKRRTGRAAGQSFDRR